MKKKSDKKSSYKIIQKKMVSLQTLNFHRVKDREYFKQFDIKFGSLALGKHQMEVEVNRLFFEKHTNDDIQNCDIKVNITIERKESMVILNFDIQGNVVCFCDICLEELVIPVEKQETVILKITGHSKENDNENIVFLGENEYFYNIEQLMYEYIVTSIPIRKVHQETGYGNCNPDMLKRIEEIKNSSNFHEDERWKVLKEKFK
jgi:uncharacterized metal-binding protein YceD (DUF177 family)